MSALTQKQMAARGRDRERQLAASARLEDNKRYWHFCFLKGFREAMKTSPRVKIGRARLRRAMVENRALLHVERTEGHR
jgi:hypothetical protein